MAKKILIIEDEETLRSMYVDKFSREGLNVIAAPDATEGLSLAKKENPDLIILDMLLPEKNGIYFLEQLRNDPAISKTKVIAFSNYDGPDIKEETKKWGVKSYLIKTGYTPNQMVKKIKTYLK